MVNALFIRIHKRLIFSRLILSIRRGERAVMSDAIDKSTKRLLRYLVAGSFFMVAGAAIYATQTETLDHCKVLYEAELLKIK